MTKREMAERIARLEEEVAELKERGPETHLHYHYPPVQYVYPKPQTWWGSYTLPWVQCGSGVSTSTSGISGQATTQSLGMNRSN